jgi:proline iminopeptidase
MKRVLKVLGKILLGFVILGIVIFIVLYLATVGTYEVAETVEQDASIPSITLGGVTFHAETFGDASNPVVIVVHGGPGGDYRYLLNLQELSDEYYVVFYDQRGSGLSPRVDPSDITTDSAIEDLDRIVEHYGKGEPVNLVGHSWGGVLVTAYVGRYPEKVAHLVVAEPGALSNEAYTDYQQHFAQSIDLSLTLKVIRLWFESLHVSGPDTYARSDYFLGHMQEEWEFSPANPYNCPGTPVPEDHFWRAGAAAYRGNFSSARDEDGNTDWSVMTEGLENYTATVLMLVSDCNRWVGLDFQRTYNLDLYPSAEVVVISGAGHDMFWDNPQDSIAAVRDFLGR